LAKVARYAFANCSNVIAGAAFMVWAPLPLDTEALCGVAGRHFLAVDFVTEASIGQVADNDGQAAGFERFADLRPE
jgi:hypothetical protein